MNNGVCSDSDSEDTTAPYYAVIFTPVGTHGDKGCAEAARQQEGVSVSCRASLDGIKAWKEQPEHKRVQARRPDSPLTLASTC